MLIHVDNIRSISKVKVTGSRSQKDNKRLATPGQLILLLVWLTIAEKQTWIRNLHK